MLSLGAKSVPPKVTNIPYIPHLAENNVRTGFFEYGEYVVVRDALPDHLRPVNVIGYYTSVREGEILNLQWPQVHGAREGIRTPTVIPPDILSAKIA